jgi:hypothetical protein
MVVVRGLYEETNNHSYTPYIITHHLLSHTFYLSPTDASTYQTSVAHSSVFVPEKSLRSAPQGGK